MSLKLEGRKFSEFAKNLPEISDVTGANMVGVKGGSAGSVGAYNFEEKESLKVVEDINYFTTESGLTSGYYINRNSGAATELSIYSCTNYVCVEPGSFVSCLFLSSDAVALCFYKDDKTFVSALTCSDGFAERTFEVPYNSRFVRFCCKTSDVPASGLYIKKQKEFFSVKNEEIEKTYLEKRMLKVGAGLEDGKYINTKGNTTSLSAYACSDYIPVEGSEEISLFATISGSATVAFYDSWKKFISAITQSDLPDLGYSSADSDYRTFTTPANTKFVRFSVMKKDLLESGCFFARSSFRGDLQKQLNGLVPSLYKDVRFYTTANGLIDGVYINGGHGREVSLASYASSGFICIKGARYVKIGSTISLDGSVGVGFYTKGGNTISVISGNSASALGFRNGFDERLIPVPSNAYHVRFCAFKTDIPEEGCRFEIMSRPVASLDEVSATPYELLIHKVCFLGDSLTVGADYTSGSYGGIMSTNFPYYMAKMGKFEYEIKAHAGDTAKDCWDSFVKNLDVTQYDCFVIWLGTNYGLTRTLDTDVLPYEDYNDYADTNTGCYCKIISKIITNNPTAKIFLGGIYITGGGATLLQTNETLADIAALDMYKDNVVGVCWMNDFSLYNNRDQSAVIHPGGNNVHFGKVGNFVLARYWLENIRMLMAEKLSMFEYPRIV